MRTKFLVADSIKSEPNGKLTILQPFVVSAGAGTYTWKFRIDNTDCSHSFEVRLVKAAG